MKLRGTQPKNTTLLWTIIIIAFGVISGVAAWQLTDRDELINDPETVRTDTKKVVEKPAAVMIELPGAAPISPMSGDYTKDDHIWRLVNKSHPLTDLHYRPANIQLASVASRTDKSSDERSIRADIMPDAEKLFADAKAQGINLQIGSGFRSYELQNTYYSNYSRVHGQEAADTFSAKPGYSEHQTGLVMDLATTDHVCYLDECFGETSAGKWLAEHAHEYGFILRYPQGKKGITDFIYEPWHFRYVGKDLAGALKQSGLTLDEAAPYLETARQKISTE